MDLSSSTGYALFEYSTFPTLTPNLKQYGVLQNSVKVKDHGDYPWSILFACRSMADKILRIVEQYKPDQIVIEEIELGRQRIVQKFLAGVHYEVLQRLLPVYEGKVFYISSSEWRRCLGVGLNKEDKKRNSRLSKAKSEAKRNKKTLDKKALGINGKFTKKHAAIRWVNEHFSLNLRATDDDQADGICQGAAYLRNCRKCDGK